MKKTASIFIVITLLLSLVAFNKESLISPDETELIGGQTFNKTLLIDGHKYDGLVIDSCIFENIKGDGIQIRDVDNLTIKNCIFRNIDNDAIRFRNSGSSDKVIIDNNLIHTIQGNGILAYETHINTRITGNTIYNVGRDNSSSLAGAPHHGIYFQGSNVEITGNKIYDIINENGNCISIRSSGKISGNILYHANKHGISYYSDHPGNNEQLLIENNFIYDNGGRCINLSGNGEAQNHIGQALIWFNTLISSNKSPIGISNDLNHVMVTINGNIAIRTDGNSTYVYSDISFEESNNLTSNSDIGFIDFANRNLHIKSSSIAKGHATGISIFPDHDLDDDPRESSNLDAGADEID